MRILSPCTLLLASWLILLFTIPSRAKTLEELLVHDNRLNVLSAGFSSLNGIISPNRSPPYTIFAPTDRAFALSLSEGSLYCGYGRLCSDLLDWVHSSEYTSRDIQRHVFYGQLRPQEMQDGMVLVAVDGSHVKVEQEDGWDVHVGGAVVTFDAVTEADDGVLVVVNSLFVDYSLINTTDIRGAELITDVGPFTEEERTIMVEEISENINCYRKTRSLNLPDGGVSDHSVLAFNPAVYLYETPTVSSQNGGGSRKGRKSKQHRGMRFEEPHQVIWEIPKDTKLPVNDEDVAYMSVLELASLLRQGKVTSTQLTELYLERLKRYDPVLETVVTFTEELAFQQAAEADAEIKKGDFRGPLHGIPYGLKDLIAVPDYPTTWGAAPYMNQSFDEGAWCYERLRDAGAVLVAKLATGAMAWGDVWFGGRTRNPWNIAEGSCGSSSGSGAATVAGLLPFAIGTETWGSMSCPSETMGVIGFRPTFGTVGRTGVMTLASSLDKVGPFCRTAIDCGVITDAMRGKDPDDPGSVETSFHSPLDLELSSLRIGFANNADIEVVNQLSSLGATMMPVSLNFTVNARSLMNTILGSEAGAHFDHWLRSDKSKYMREQHKWPSYIRGARLIPAVEYVQANRARGRLMKEVLEAFKGLDGVVVPARGKGEEGAVGNVLGLPQIVFPVNFDNLKGSSSSPRKDPRAQAVVGLPFSDHKVLAIGHAFLSNSKASLLRPPIDNVEANVLGICLPFSKCDMEEPKITLVWQTIGGSD